MIALLLSVSFAESWCAEALPVHEWGVRTVGVAPKELPRFLVSTQSAPAPAKPVRSMDPDSGMRELPIVQVHPSWGWGETIPFALEVDFAHGEAAAWYPPVDRRVSAKQAHSSEARAAKAKLVRAWKEQDRELDFAGRELGPDPTKQLGWDSLTLRKSANKVQPAPEQPWVHALRKVDGAAWIDTGSATERFLFYDGVTSEEQPISLEKGETYGPGRTHLIVRNNGKTPVHELVLTTAEHQITVPQIPAGATAGFLLEEHPRRDETTRSWLAERWTYDGKHGMGCEMMRDPAVPMESAAGHKLLASEVSVVLDAWRTEMFAPEGVTLTFREDVAALDDAMPLAAYTDMWHHIVLHRLGLVVVGNLELP